MEYEYHSFVIDTHPDKTCKDINADPDLNMNDILNDYGHKGFYLDIIEKISDTRLLVVMCKHIQTADDNDSGDGGFMIFGFSPDVP